MVSSPGGDTLSKPDLIVSHRTKTCK